jgi:hypothetical protein
LPAQGRFPMSELLLAGAQLAGLTRKGAFSLERALLGGGPVGRVDAERSVFSLGGFNRRGRLAGSLAYLVRGSEECIRRARILAEAG